MPTHHSVTGACFAHTLNNADASKPCTPQVKHMSGNHPYSDTSTATTLVPYKHTPFAYTINAAHITCMYTCTRTFTTCIHVCTCVCTSGDLKGVNAITVSSKCTHTQVRHLACFLTTTCVGPPYSFAATRAPSRNGQSCPPPRASRPTGERTHPDPSLQLW